MHSKPLKQAIDLALDTMGMRGPVKRRDVAEQVLRSAPADYWSLADDREARLAYIQSEVAARMSETHSQEFIARHLGEIPEKFKTYLSKVPRFICISPRGGREAEHVMAFIATPEHWQASYYLKDSIVQATSISRDRDREIHDLLVSRGAQSLRDLFSAREAAE